MLESTVFYLFSAVLLFAGLRVITARNPVHGVLFLVLAFFPAAVLWLLLRAEFLAIALVVVYVGAVMVLFLFVVMMLDINLERVREGFWRNLPLVLLVAIIAAIALTLRERKDTRKQDPSRQVRVRREERVRLVSMPTEKE